MSTDLQKEEAQLKKRFLELYEKAYQRNVFLFTGFLGLAEQESFWQCSGQMNRDSFSLSGGMEDAERVMIRFGNPQELGYEQEFPIVCMHLLIWNYLSSLQTISHGKSHRSTPHQYKL